MSTSRSTGVEPPGGAGRNSGRPPQSITVAIGRSSRIVVSLSSAAPVPLSKGMSSSAAEKSPSGTASSSYRKLTKDSRSAPYRVRSRPFSSFSLPDHSLTMSSRWPSFILLCTW